MTIARLVSPLHAALLDGEALQHAQVRDLRGMAVPLQLGEAAHQQALLQSVALADVSFLPGVLVKGPLAAEFLQASGVQLPPDVLAVGALESGGLIARTGGSEFFLEDGPSSNVVEQIEAALQANPRGAYRVLRQDASLVIGGPRGGELLRHVCGYDFITEPHDKLVFTSVAGVSCSMLRRTLNGIPVLRLWTDGTYGIYIWRTLLEIAVELGGGAVGTALFYPEIREA
jgi:glycine cleavage system aminomethyltransferase T